MDKPITALFALIGLFALLFFYTTTIGGYNMGTVVHHSGEIKVQVFDKPYELVTGLTEEDRIDEDEGAVFIFGKEGTYEFITKNMKMSVDMIWLDRNMKVVGIREDVPPCELEVVRKCPKYTSPEPCQYVVEVNSGYASRHDIKVGDQFELYY